MPAEPALWKRALPIKFLDFPGELVFPVGLQSRRPGLRVMEQHHQQPLDSLIEQRKAKLAAPRAKEIDLFPNKFAPAKPVSMLIDSSEQSGRIQVCAQKNVLGDKPFDIFRHPDLGDFIGAAGHLFATKTGEISFKPARFRIFAKALRPPPAKDYGLEAAEISCRQRHLDLIANPGVKLAGTPFCIERTCSLSPV